MDYDPEKTHESLRVLITYNANGQLSYNKYYIYYIILIYTLERVRREVCIWIRKYYVDLQAVEMRSFIIIRESETSTQSRRSGRCENNYKLYMYNIA